MGADWIKGAALYLKERDPILAKVIDEIGECTLKTSNDYFGALARSIIFQNFRGMRPVQSTKDLLMPAAVP